MLGSYEREVEFSGNNGDFAITREVLIIANLSAICIKMASCSGCNDDGSNNVYAGTFVIALIIDRVRRSSQLLFTYYSDIRNLLERIVFKDFCFLAFSQIPPIV